MRLTEQQRQVIEHEVKSLAGDEAQIILFGSRVDDTQKGGDIDLLVTLQREVEHPALLAAQIGARLVRRLRGRKVDVILSAPNLKTLPIHEIARKNGVAL